MGKNLAVAINGREGGGRGGATAAATLLERVIHRVRSDGVIFASLVDIISFLRLMTEYFTENSI